MTTRQIFVQDIFCSGIFRASSIPFLKAIGISSSQTIGKTFSMVGKTLDKVFSMITRETRVEGCYLEFQNHPSE